MAFKQIHTGGGSMGRGIIIFLVLVAAFAAANLMEQFAYADAGHEKMEPAKLTEDSAPEYIRITTPAGYNVVLGIRNSLQELEHETVETGEGPVKVFRLTVNDTSFNIFPDKPIKGWGFNDRIPATIRVTEGDRIRIILKNETEEVEHTLHVHGQSKPMSMEGVPFLGQKPLKKGESYPYEFTVNNSGTSWYHCHVDSAHHVDMGMYGAFIVEPKETREAYEREYIMILDEWPTAHVHMHQKAEPDSGHDEHGIITLHGDSPPMHDQDGMEKKKRDWYPETYEARRMYMTGLRLTAGHFHIPSRLS
jgi:FtsP/CotA-like multicopper oxidase with cupredoxin domain